MKTSLIVVVGLGLIGTACSGSTVAPKQEAQGGDVKEVTTTTVPPVTGPLKLSPTLFGNAKPAFDPASGAPGKLSVVQNGPLVRSSIPIMIANRTSKPMTGIEVTGNVRQQGTLVASGSSHNIHPDILPPGEVGIGYVYFQRAPDAPPNLSFEFSVTGREPRESGSSDLRIVEATNTSRGIVGTATNPGTVKITGPLSVTALCLSKTGEILADHADFADPTDGVEPAGTASFSIDFVSGETCPTTLIGASGHLF